MRIPRPLVSVGRKRPMAGGEVTEADTAGRTSTASDAVPIADSTSRASAADSAVLDASLAAVHAALSRRRRKQLLVPRVRPEELQFNLACFVRRSPSGPQNYFS